MRFEWWEVAMFFIPFALYYLFLKVRRWLAKEPQPMPCGGVVIHYKVSATHNPYAGMPMYHSGGYLNEAIQAILEQHEQDDVIPATNIEQLIAEIEKEG